MKRGFTLVELMIAVAILGILIVLFDGVSAVTSRQALEEVQRVRATELAKALVRSGATGTTLSAEARARLERDLPEVKVEPHREGPTTRFTVSWRAPSGARREVELAGFTRGGAR